MPIPEVPLSCCCDWGTGRIGRQPPQFWYFSAGNGTLRRRLKSTLADDDVSTFANAVRIVQIDDEGNFYYYEQSTARVKKYQYDGTQIWDYTPTGGGLQFNSPHIFAVDSDKNVYFAFQVDLSGNTIRESLRVVKLDSSGSVVWTYDKTPAELGPAGTFTELNPLGVCVDLSGNVHITGRRAVGNTGPPITSRTQGSFEIHLDSDGNEDWTDISTNVNTGTNMSYGQQCVCDEDGNIIVRYNPFTSQSNTIQSNDTITLKGYAADGTPQFTHKLPGTAVGAETEFPLTVLIQYYQGNLYCSGEFLTAATGNGFYARYSGSDYSTEDWTEDVGISTTVRFTLDAVGFVYGHHVTSGVTSAIFNKLNQSDGVVVETLTTASPGYAPFFPMSPPGAPIQFMQ